MPINESIKRAHGKYFKVLDGDDWVDVKEFDGFLEDLFRCEAALMVNDYNEVYVNKSIRRKIIDAYDLNNKYDIKDMDSNNIVPMHSITVRTDKLQQYEFGMSEHRFYADTEYVFDFSTISSYRFYANSTQFSFCVLTRKNALSNLMIYDIAYYADKDTSVYEPYIGETTHLYLDEPPRKIGDYADYIDWQNKKIIRNVGETTFNGSESWIATDDTLTGEYQGFAVSNSTYNIPTASNLLCLSNKLPYSATSAKNVIMITNSNTDALRVIIGSDYVSDLTVDSFKTWLVNNNITVVYPINASIEEIIDIKNYETVDSDVTNIYLLTSVEPSNIYLKYYKSLPTALENVASKNDIININNEIILTGGNAAGIIV